MAACFIIYIFSFFPYPLLNSFISRFQFQIIKNTNILLAVLVAAFVNIFLLCLNWFGVNLFVNAILVSESTNV